MEAQKVKYVQLCGYDLGNQTIGLRYVHLFKKI